MIDATQQFKLREYPRYPTREDRQVEVSIRKRASAPDAFVVSELLDFSRRGVRLTVDVPFELDDAVRLKIKLSAPATDLSILASVCWIQQESESVWTLGCQFVDELPFHVVPRLAVAGYLERRSEGRYEANFSAVLRPQSDAAEFAVQVQDISGGGFRIRSPEPIKAGEEFALLLECAGSHVEILARAQWRTAADGVYTIGCSFPSADGFALLSQAAAAAEFAGAAS